MSLSETETFIMRYPIFLVLALALNLLKGFFERSGKPFNKFRASAGKNIIYLCCVIVFSLHTPLAARNVRPPRLTVVLVVDQFAHHYIDKLYPHLKYGLKYLIDHGVYYTRNY